LSFSIKVEIWGDQARVAKPWPDSSWRNSLRSRLKVPFKEQLRRGGNSGRLFGRKGAQASERKGGRREESACEPASQRVGPSEWGMNADERNEASACWKKGEKRAFPSATHQGEKRAYFIASLPQKRGLDSSRILSSLFSFHPLFDLGNNWPTNCCTRGEKKGSKGEKKPIFAIFSSLSLLKKFFATNRRQEEESRTRGEGGVLLEEVGRVDSDSICWSVRLRTTISLTLLYEGRERASWGGERERIFTGGKKGIKARNKQHLRPRIY